MNSVKEKKAMVELVVPALPWAKDLELFRSKERDTGWRGEIESGNRGRAQTLGRRTEINQVAGRKQFDAGTQIDNTIPNFDNNQTHQGEKLI